MEHRTNSDGIRPKKVQPFGCSRLNLLGGGFTLVEVLVSSAIITVVMLVAVGSIITMQDANRKAQAVRAIIDNLHGAIENMSRKIRTGSTYYCGEAPDRNSFSAQNCDARGWDSGLTFLASDDVDAGDNGAPTVFRLQCNPYSSGGADQWPNDQGLCRSGQTGTIVYYKEGLFGSSNAYFPLTDPKINVKSLRFYVRDALGASGYPSVLLTVKGTINIERVKIETPFNLQTTISQYLK